MITKMYKVLLVEDETIHGLTERTTHLEFVEDFALIVVETASEAEKTIREQGNEFDAIIIDVRLNPGHDPKWIEVFSRPEERLGIYLVNDIAIDFPHLLNRMGVTTIERWKDIQPLFAENAKIDPSVQYYSKVDSNEPKEYEQFIRQIIHRD